MKLDKVIQLDYIARPVGPLEENENAFHEIVGFIALCQTQQNEFYVHSEYTDLSGKREVRHANTSQVYEMWEDNRRFAIAALAAERQYYMERQNILSFSVKNDEIMNTRN